MFPMPMIPPTRLPPLTFAYFACVNKNYPAGLQANDLAVMVVNVAPASGNFDNWKELKYQTTDIYAIGAYAKKLAGTETGILPKPPGGIGDGSVIVFRPSRPYTDFTHSVWQGQYSAAAPAVQTIPGASAAAPVIHVAFNIRASGAVTITCNPVMQGNIVPLDGLRYDYRIDNTTPVNQTVQMNDTGSGNTLISGYIAPFG